LYVETGVRAMGGNVSRAATPRRQNYRPSLELVRLTPPRRALNNDHLQAVATA
jgi:tryptophanase